MGVVLGREDILDELKLVEERIPFGKGEVIVAELSGYDFMQLWSDPAIKGGDGKVDQGRFPYLLAARCIRNEQGGRIFSDDDLPLLQNSKMEKMLSLIEAAKRLNGLSGEGEAVKNSVETVGGDSLSVSASS